MREEYSVRSLCRAFGVSESGFYAYLNRPKKESNLRDQKDCQMIWKVYLRSRGTIGAKAIAGTLKSQFHYVINHKRVARLATEMNLKSRIRMRKSPDFTAPKEPGKGWRISPSLLISIKSSMAVRSLIYSSVRSWHFTLATTRMPFL